MNLSPSINYLTLVLWLACLVIGHAAPAAYQPDWRALDARAQIGFSGLPLDDPLLAQAYAELFIMNGVTQKSAPSWWEPAKNDLLRRGNAASPMLLRLFKEHPLQQLREDMLFKIENYPSIDIAPFLAQARTYWAANKGTRPRTCYAIAYLLCRHGTREDLAVLEEMKNHPIKEVAFVIEPDIQRMMRRLAAASVPDPQDQEADKIPDTVNPRKQTGDRAGHQEVKETAEDHFLTLAVVFCGAAVVAAAALWQFEKGLRRRRGG